MTERDAMFKNLLANREDETARLVFADKVQEDGDEPLAQLIRIGVPCNCVDPERLVAVDQRCFICAGKWWARRCQHEDCRNPAFACTVDDADVAGEVAEFFCSGHAPEHGYCAGCGLLFTGGGLFVTPRSGLCQWCREPDEDWHWEGEGYGGPADSEDM